MAGNYKRGLYNPLDIVNIGLHVLLKTVRPMLPLVMKHSTAVV